MKDIHQKLGSGIGSLGKLRYYVLIEGPSTSTSDDVILELKQSAPSVVATVDNGQLPAADYLNNEEHRAVRTNKAQSDQCRRSGRLHHHRWCSVLRA